MGSAPWLQPTLTGVFVVCAVLYVVQARAPGAWQSRVAWSMHAVLAVYLTYLGLFTASVGHSLYHAVMMASMVPMALAMFPTAMPDTASMGAMPGMKMAGAVDLDAGAPSTPGWVSWTCGPAAVFFLGTALWSFFVLIRGPQPVRQPPDDRRNGGGIRGTRLVNPTNSPTREED